MILQMCLAVILESGLDPFILSKDTCHEGLAFKVTDISMKQEIFEPTFFQRHDHSSKRLTSSPLSVS